MAIPINHEMRQTAFQLEQQVLKSVAESNRADYLPETNPRRYYVGFLGEQVFLQFLSENNVRSYYAPQTNGKPDKFDFLVMTSAGDRVAVDVKTASKSYYSKLMIHRKQYEKTGFTGVYVAVRLNGESYGEVLGWTSGTNLLTDPSDYQQLYLPYSYLFSMESLVSKLHFGSQVVKYPEMAFTS
jgi:hypothetical protein